MIDVGGSVGNYVVKSKLGEGGMGIVWLAEHPLIGKRVAIKVIHPNYARNPEAVSRFFTEAQAVNRIGHPNIVDITDFGQSPGGESYFVMEYLLGQALSTRMTEGGLDLRRAVHVAAQACDALAASHAAGILHRDLKPDNIYLLKRGQDPDFVKVLDFGLAKLTGDSNKSSHKTRTGSMMGTPYYMAPEQCAGKADIDGRADIYSIGVILFEMTTGQVPFPGEGYGEIIVKHMTQPAPHARTLNPSVPEWLDALIDRCLAKERTERVQSMGELHAILSEQLELMPGGPRLQRASTTAGGSNPPGSGSVPPDQAKPISTMNLAAGEAGPGFETPGGPRGRTGLIIGAAAFAAAAIVVGVIATRGGGADKGAAAGAKAAADAASREDEVPSAAPETPVVPVAVASDRPVGAPSVEEVTFELRGDPAGVKITLADGTVVCAATPCTWKTTRAATPLTLTFARAGYVTRQEQLTPDRNQAVDKNLVADKSASGSSGRPGGRPSTRPTDRPTDKPAGKPGEKPGESGDNLMKPAF